VLCRKAGLVKLGCHRGGWHEELANASPEETGAIHAAVPVGATARRKRSRRCWKQAERVDREEEEPREARRNPTVICRKRWPPPSNGWRRSARSNKRLEEETRQKAEKVRAERQASGDKHRNEAAKKRHQRATKPIEKINPQGNLVDPDSKLLKDPVTGGFIQAFNAQIAVDYANTDHMLPRRRNERTQRPRAVAADGGNSSSNPSKPSRKVFASRCRVFCERADGRVWKRRGGS